jgi:hypothetical protein
MGPSVVTRLTAILISAVLSASCGGSDNEPFAMDGLVVSVADGDSFTVRLTTSARERVRLIGHRRARGLAAAMLRCPGPVEGVSTCGGPTRSADRRRDAGHPRQVSQAARVRLAPGRPRPRTTADRRGVWNRIPLPAVVRAAEVLSGNRAFRQELEARPLVPMRRSFVTEAPRRKARRSPGQRAPSPDSSSRAGPAYEVTRPTRFSTSPCDSSETIPVGLSGRPACLRSFCAISVISSSA